MSTVAPFSTSRTLNASRERVFEVYTDPAHLLEWMKPVGFASVHAQMDFRVGGSYHYGVRARNGMHMWGKQAYREIVPNEKLVFIQSFSNAEGGLAPHPMSPAWPLEILATTTFEDASDGKTKVTVSWYPINSHPEGEATFDAARGAMQMGFNSTFVSLEDYLATLS